MRLGFGRQENDIGFAGNSSQNICNGVFNGDNLLPQAQRSSLSEDASVLSNEFVDGVSKRGGE